MAALVTALAAPAREAPERHSRRLLWVLHVVVPLVAAVAVYAFWRPWPQPGSAPLWDLLVLSAPDGLWAYAATASVGLIWRDRPGPGRCVWLAAAILLATALECGQAVGAIAGTFDWNDVAACAGGWLLAVTNMWRWRSSR